MSKQQKREPFFSKDPMAEQQLQVVPQVGEEIFMIHWGHHNVIMDKYQDNINVDFIENGKLIRAQAVFAVHMLKWAG